MDDATTETDAELAARAAGWAKTTAASWRRPNGRYVNDLADDTAVGPLLADLAAKGWWVRVESELLDGRAAHSSFVRPPWGGDDKRHDTGCDDQPAPAAALVAAVAAAVRAKGGAER